MGSQWLLLSCVHCALGFSRGECQRAYKSVVCAGQWAGGKFLSWPSCPADRQTAGVRKIRFNNVIPLLDKVAFQATGICRMVLVMQTCDLSESSHDTVASLRLVGTSIPHWTATYRAVSLSVRMCELLICIWLLYIQVCSSDCVNFNLRLCHNFVSMFKLSNLLSLSTSAGWWDAMKKPSIPDYPCLQHTVQPCTPHPQRHCSCHSLQNHIEPLGIQLF